MDKGLALPWPSLNYSEWKETYQTLHRWTQIIGKVRLSKTQWKNHSWNSTLYVTPLGLSTSTIPHAGGSFSVEFDFASHQLVALASTGERVSFPLQNESVADFFRRTKDALSYLGIDVQIDPHPNETLDHIPFFSDAIHSTFNSAQAENFWQVLVKVEQVLEKFRANFIGKSSPVQFFWGSFDLAVSRFSGRRAPEHPGGIPHLPDRVTKEAYSHEVSSCGFWPGNEAYPQAAFYSYAYPEPAGFKDSRIEPASAFYHEGLGEFLLPYDAVRNSPSPEKDLSRFLESTYEAAADLGHWDREALEKSPYLDECRQLAHSAPASHPHPLPTH